MAQSINEVMTHDPIVMDESTPLARVAGRMREGDIGATIVTADDRIRGIVTDRDIVVRAVADGRDMNETPVRDILSEQLVTLDSEDTVEHAIEIMRRHAIRRVPVVDDDRPVGIVSIGDLALERDERSALADISAAEPNR